MFTRAMAEANTKKLREAGEKSRAAAIREKRAGKQEAPAPSVQPKKEGK